MGLRGSKSKKSYEVAVAADSKSQRKASLKNQKSAATEESISPVPSSPKPESKPPPAIEEVNQGPEWLNESQFEELLAANVDQFSKILKFRVKAAMAPGENYATLMLRITIDVELTGESRRGLVAPNKTIKAAFFYSSWLAISSISTLFIGSRQ